MINHVVLFKLKNYSVEDKSRIIAEMKSLLEGLKETWDWFVNNQDEYLQKKNYFKEQK